MKIKVEEVNCCANSTCVRFSSSYGDSSGIWVGDLPREGEIFDVELEIKEELIWDKTIRESNKEVVSISCEANLFRMVAKVVSSDDDYLAVSLGESIVLLEVKNAPGRMPSFVEFFASNAMLYPVYL